MKKKKLKIFNRYEKAAADHIKRLQQYERGSKDVFTVKCGEEPEEFWKIWEDATSEPRYAHNVNWNSWFIELSKAKDVTGITYKRYSDENEEDEIRNSRPHFFVYPSNEPIRFFEFEELSPETLIYAFIMKNKQKYCYAWKGEEFVPDSDVTQSPIGPY